MPEDKILSIVKNDNHCQCSRKLCHDFLVKLHSPGVQWQTVEEQEEELNTILEAAREEGAVDQDIFSRCRGYTVRIEKDGRPVITHWSESQDF